MAYRDHDRRRAKTRERKATPEFRILERERRRRYEAKHATKVKAKRHVKWNARKYGLTLEAYDAMMIAQSGRCAICLDNPEPRGRGTGLHVDHCHATGRVRGLLCSRCNMGIGLFEERVEVFAEVITYLRGVT